MWIVCALALLLAVAIDVGVSQTIPWLGIGFSSVLLFCMIAYITMPLPFAVGWALVIGLVMDVFSPAVFGSYLFICLFVIFLMQILQTTWFKQQSVLALIVIISITVSTALPVLIGIQTVAVRLGVLAFNPLAQVTWYGFLIGVFVQCLAIGVLVKTLSSFKKFVLL